ncbi:MAG: IS110 family transposase [Acidobacteria bacterium]|nr:IS110 family transposase [Acidobacteriota bacterium]MCA1650659.1 IS110 family transposase [Acidobacteriota bacterium]
MENRSMFVGLDVHKETIDVSIAEGDRHGEVRHYGVIASDLEPLDKVMRALRASDRRLHFVYEAGPCGFGIYRHLTAHGEDCVVVSPSMIPKRSGDRIKTDRRDSLSLARLHRAGELRAIYVPDATDEAMRDLVRGRDDAVVVGTQAKYRLKAFLLRQGRRYPGRAGWTIPYRRWLANLSFPTAAQHVALHEYRDTIDETERRIDRLTEQLRQLAPTWRWAPVVDAFQALRGVSFITAVGLVAELGDLTRFRHPRELMAYLGLVPSEYSSGPSVRRGGITKAGNPHVRRLLAESAWAYQGIARIGRQQLYRQEGLPKVVCDIAWKAQLRLTGRFRRLVARGKAKPKVATAIARELTGFMWAIAQEVSPASQ